MKRLLYEIRNKIFIGICKWIIIPKYKNKIINNLKRYNVQSIQHTAYVLLNSKKSIGRFGDGEIEWILGDRNDFAGFEKNSSELSRELLDVLLSNNKNFLIALPDAFNMPKEFTSKAKIFWYSFFIRNYKKIMPYLNKNKVYYNTSVTRPYMDYNTRNIANYTFSLLKKLLSNKNILVVEGNESRVGATDDLFKYSNIVKRIECPIVDAFKVRKIILLSIEKFLNKTNKKFIILLSLGPTATILSYKLCIAGYRAIDVGHIDLEYEWYLLGAKEKINLPYKYVNENKKGHSALPINNIKYKDQIVREINLR